MKEITLFLLLLVLCTSRVLSCGGGSSSCTYTTCSTQWGAWSPSVAQGSCRWQSQKANHIYTTHKQSGGCPGSSKCSTKDQSRYLCSCRVISHCRWGAWGPFQGSVTRGTCGTQRRYRYAQKTYTYTNRVGSCSGTVTDCPRNSESETRQWCNCRKAARCDPSSWSAWSGHVADGACATQTSYRDFSPTYQYIEQLSNCHGIQGSCQSRQTNSRSYCMCRYVHCTLKDWSTWKVIPNTGTCPDEERQQGYQPKTLYKGAHSNCVGIGPTACPGPNKETRRKPTTCPALVAPAHGTLQGAACNGASSTCGATCALNCDQNYPLEGKSYAICLTTGHWSNALGACKDSIKPIIQCPVIKPTPNKANENFAEVDLPDATATDNSGSVTVSCSHTSPLKVTVGSPVAVDYTATDAAGNTRKCTVSVEAIDTEPPKVEFCPEDIIISTETVPKEVIWKTATFSDNVDPPAALSITLSTQNGQRFYEGTHPISYTAHDRALNEVKCKFNVQISKMKCPLYDPPKHGAATCNIKKMNVEEVHVCTVACKPNFWFLQGDGIPKLWDFYLCSSDGGWQGQNKFDMTNPGSLFNPIPRGKSPWPDCSKGDPPSEAKKNFKVIGGSCSGTDITKLKDDVVAALMSDPVIQSLFCAINSQHCIVQNVKVYCSSVKKRSTGTVTNQVHISFDFFVQDGAPSADQNTEMTKMTKLVTSMGSLGAEVKRVAASKLQTSAVNVVMEEKAAVLACEAGSTLSIVNGSGSTNERTKCVKCPAGTMYDATSQTCLVCPVGHYQELEGQSACKKCKEGFSTHGYKASNYTECKEICSPGTYSKDGLATCIACPKGSYQPSSNSTSCIPCPDGKGTDKRGAVFQANCVTRAIQVKIKSEGCNDPTVAVGTCGVATIQVNGVDHSKKRRGYNFVVVNQNTGVVESTASFDTHGNYNAKSDLKRYVDGLANGKIVLIGIQDEGTAKADQYNVYNSLISLGGTAGSFQLQYRGSFAMLGYKGTTKPSWVKQLAPPSARGPAIIEQRIPLV